MRRRLAALTALVLACISLALAIILTYIEFYRGAAAMILLIAATYVAWHGLLRRGVIYVAGLVMGVILLIIVADVLIAAAPMLTLVAIISFGLSLFVGRYALKIRVALQPASRVLQHPVLFWNPRSGGGKALRFRLAEEARARHIEPIELTQAKDFEQQIREAVDAGADALAIAGGDGSQAMVAGIAAERDLQFACIPAGTLNHFALDLGVDRNDVVGALDAFVNGGERLVDLGEVNGFIFVNNVSIGIYGDAVQHRDYRNAKIRTLFDTVSEVVHSAGPPQLQWQSPDGKDHNGAVAIVVSNNRYRLGYVLADGTRPRLDEGILGITVLSVPGDEPGAWEWGSSSFEVHAPQPVPVGIDGEARVLNPPLRFRIRRAALHCRIARQHPGASPSAYLPQSAWALIRTLAGIAAGHDPRPFPGAR